MDRDRVTPELTLQFVYAGRVRRLRPRDTFMVGEVPGKIPLVVCDPDIGPVLAYFDAKRRPKVGIKLGVRGTWVQMSEPATFENTPPGFPISAGMRCVQDQVDVEGWTRVSESYDWFMERLRAGALSRAAG